MFGTHGSQRSLGKICCCGRAYRYRQWLEVLENVNADIQLTQTPEIICIDRCSEKMTPAREWNPSTWNQVRWCRRCETFMHTLCITHYVVDIADHADKLDGYGQPYLRYLLDGHLRQRTGPPRMSLDFNDDPELQGDAHDEAENHPMPLTTWQEVAVLPIRRRTFPMEAPETIEVVVQHAIQKVLAGHGADAVPDFGEWLHAIAPQAGLRAAKVILNKNLRQLRHGTPPRRYRCPRCLAQII